MMMGLWFAEAGKYDVFPLHAVQRKGLRPKPHTDRELYVYWPGATHIDNEAAVNVRMRPFSVIAHAAVRGRRRGRADRAGRQAHVAGWSLFVKDGRLIYKHNYVGLEHYRVVSTETIPEGEVKLGLEFAITGKFEITPELTQAGIQGVKGKATLYINDRPVGRGEIGKTVPFGWSLSGEGLCCGYDSETPVSELYRSPFKLPAKSIA